MWPGTAYLVGERGPEVFMSGAAGRILSNEDSREALAPRATVVNMTVNTPDPNAFRRSKAQIVGDLSRSARRLGWKGR